MSNRKALQELAAVIRDAAPFSLSSDKEFLAKVRSEMDKATDQDLYQFVCTLMLCDSLFVENDFGEFVSVYGTDTELLTRIRNFRNNPGFDRHNRDIFAN